MAPDWSSSVLGRLGWQQLKGAIHQRIARICYLPDPGRGAERTQREEDPGPSLPGEKSDNLLMTAGGEKEGEKRKSCLGALKWTHPERARVGFKDLML